MTHGSAYYLRRSRELAGQARTLDKTAHDRTQPGGVRYAAAVYTDILMEKAAQLGLLALRLERRERL